MKWNTLWDVSTGGACDEPAPTCAPGRICDVCLDASPRAHACSATAPILLVHAEDPYDALIPAAQAGAMFDSLEASGKRVSKCIVRRDEVISSDCPSPMGVAHGFSPCLLGPALREMDAIVRAALSP
jgi:hypothetical protein